MPTEQFTTCVGFGQKWTDKFGAKYQDWNIPTIMKMIENPAQKEKDEAPWVIFSDVKSREHDAHRQNGEYAALWADIDEGSPSFDQVRAAVEAVIGSDVAYGIYSTRSATPTKRKWRVIVPLTVLKGQNTIKGDIYELVQQCFNDMLEQQGLIPDRVTERAGQLCYLPNCASPEMYKGYIHPKQEFFNYVSQPVWTEAFIAIRERAAKERADMERRLIEGRQRAAARVAMGEMSPIDAVNSMYDMKTMLENYGYKKKGGRFLSPFSSSGIAGVQIIVQDGKEKWYSAHGTDREILGRGRGDVFDLICYFEYGGDRTAALIGLGNELTTNDGRTINQANQDNYRDNYCSDQYSDLGDSTWEQPSSTSQLTEQANLANETEQQSLPPEKEETQSSSSHSESEALPETSEDCSEVMTSGTQPEPPTEPTEMSSVSMEECAAYDPNESPWAEAARQAAEQNAADLANGKSQDAKGSAGSTSGGTQGETDEADYLEHLRSLDDNALYAALGLVNDPIKPVDWTVKGVLQTGALGVLSGEGGAGKTTLALHLASCISGDHSFYGHRVKKIGKVIYMASEGAAGINRRLEAWRKKGYNTDDIMVLPLALGLVREAIGLFEVMRREQPVLLVIDTWGAQALDVDENDNKQVYTFLRDLHKRITMVSPSTSTMIVHHTAKGNARTARGASAFKDATDFTFNLSKVDTKGKGKDGEGAEIAHGELRLSCEKQKEGADFPTIFLNRTLVDSGMVDEDGDTEYLQMLAYAKDETQAIEAESNGFMSDEERFTCVVSELYNETVGTVGEGDKKYVKVSLQAIMNRINERHLKDKENPISLQSTFIRQLDQKINLGTVQVVKCKGSSQQAFVPMGSYYNESIDGVTAQPSVVSAPVNSATSNATPNW